MKVQAPPSFVRTVLHSFRSFLSFLLLLPALTAQVTVSPQGGQNGIAAALLTETTLDFESGVYRIKTPLQITRANVTFRCQRDVIFEVGAGGPVGFLNVLAENFTMRGATIRVPAPVPGQRVLQIRGGGARIEDCAFWADAPCAAPRAILIGTIDAYMPAIVDCSFFPDRNVSCIEINDETLPQGGTGYAITGNHFTTDDPTPFELGTTIRYREAFGCILVRGSGWGRVNENRIWGLGDAAQGSLLHHVVRIDRQLVPGTMESGHSLVRGNLIEQTAANRLMEFRGVGSMVIEANLLGYNQSGPSLGQKVGDGGIHLTGALGYPTQQGECVQVSIIDNSIHNVTRSANGSAIYCNDGREILIADNSLSLLLHDGNGIWIDCVDAAGSAYGKQSAFESGAIRGNHVASSLSAGAAIRVTDRPAPWILSGLSIVDNAHRGFAQGVAVDPNDLLGILHATNQQL